MAALRDPVSGCPWDREQDFRSIAPYTIEEAYEVADAIERGDLGELRQELGDLLLQVVFHARMAEEQGAFTFADVVAGISDKLVRRHPHVFAGEPVADAAAQSAAWEAQKARERAAGGGAPGVLGGISRSLPALARATKLGRRAATVGFDWADADGVVSKIEEELAEIGAARGTADESAVQEEVGDLLFAVANLARHLQVDPEEALRRANLKFERRFQRMEERVAGAGDWARFDARQLDVLWEAVKAAERREAR